MVNMKVCGGWRMLDRQRANSCQALCVNEMYIFTDFVAYRV